MSPNPCVLSFLCPSLSPSSHPQILDKLLDRESQTHKPQTLSSFYSSKPAAGSQRSPSKHTTTNHSGVSGATGGVSKHAPSSSSVTTVAGSSTSSSSAVALAGEEVSHQAELNPVQNSSAGETAAETREHGENSYLVSGCHVLLYCRASIATSYFQNFKKLLFSNTFPYIVCSVFG